MNKKTYQKPMMTVTELAMEAPLLAGSNGNVQAVFDDDDIIEEGTVDARKHYGVWDN